MKKIILLLAIMLLNACASVDVTKTSQGFHNPTDPNLVEILKTVPKRSYEELGTITVTNFSADETAKMHNAIRAKSAPLGANAAVITDEGIIKDGWSLERWATGVAIRYKD